MKRIVRPTPRHPSPANPLYDSPTSIDQVDDAVRSSVAVNVVYNDGLRLAQPSSLAATYALLRERGDEHTGDLAWIGLVRPNETDLASLAAKFDLHELAI